MRRYRSGEDDQQNVLNVIEKCTGYAWKMLKAINSNDDSLWYENFPKFEQEMKFVTSRAVEQAEISFDKQWEKLQEQREKLQEEERKKLQELSETYFKRKIELGKKEDSIKTLQEHMLSNADYLWNVQKRTRGKNLYELRTLNEDRIKSGMIENIFVDKRSS